MELTRLAAELAKVRSQNMLDRFDMAGVTTSSLGIGATDLNDTTSDHTSQLQSAMLVHKHLLVDTMVGVSSMVVTGFEGQTIRSINGGVVRIVAGNTWQIGSSVTSINTRIYHPASKSWFRWRGAVPHVITGASPALDGGLSSTAWVDNGGFTALAFKHENCVANGLKMDNPLMAKPATSNRLVGIDFQADFCRVTNSYFKNHVNAVVSSTAYAAHGSLVAYSHFVDCLGVGTEDRGDAVTIWGSGSVIVYNYASCLEGEDARLAYHCEQPISPPINPRPELDTRFSIIAGNMAKGGFRRHWAMENQKYGMCVDNISLGGMTWWGEAYIQCENVYARNTILYTRTPNQNAGASWNPSRGAIALMNYNKDVVIESHVTMDVGSLGTGLTIGTQTGEHHFTFNGTLVNNSSEANVAYRMLRPTNGVIGGKATGFSQGIVYTLGPISTGVYPKLRCDGAHISVSGSLMPEPIGSTGGDLILQNCVLESGTALYPLAPSGLDNIVIDGCGFRASQGFALSIFSAVKTLQITNCYNLGTGGLAIRYAGAVTQVMPNINWSVQGNTGIFCDMLHARSQLESISSQINVSNKHPNKVVVVSGSPRKAFISMGGLPSSTWISLSGTDETITPA